MCKILLPGSTSLLTIPATVYRGVQFCPVLQLAIRSAGIRWLSCLHRTATHKSCLGWALPIGARMAAPHENASPAAHLEDLLCPLKLQDEAVLSSQGDGTAPAGTQSVGKVVGDLEDESLNSVRNIVGKSQTELDAGKLDKGEGKIVGKVGGRLQTEATNVSWKLLDMLETNLDTGAAKIPGKLECKLEPEAPKDLGKLVDKSEVELDVGKLVTGEGAVRNLVVGKSETELDVRKVLGKSETELEVRNLDGGTGTTRQATRNLLRTNTGQPQTELDGATGEGTGSNAIYIAEKSTQHLEHVLQNKELKLPAGTRLVAAVERGSSIENQEFDADAYFAQLASSHYGKLILFSSRLPSTHTILSQNWSAFPPGTVCVADVQYQGKGRGGNVWESPKGCLMFSFTLQLEDGRTLPFLQYVVSLAIVEGIEAYCIKQGLVNPDVRIKWPNDLYAKGLKVGGILCTSTYSSKKFNIVVGVGLNVSNRLPTTCLEALLEEVNPSSHAIKREYLLATICSRFEHLLLAFISQGFAPLEASYYRRWLHSGQKVELEERAEDGSNSVSIVPVTVQGLTSTGFLLATDDKGEKYELHPDGNSFDFLKGLVRKKLVSS